MFYYILIKSKKLIKRRKLQDDNLIKLREAVAHGCKSYGLAAVFEFRNSEFFPTELQLSQASLSRHSQRSLMLSSFKNWLNKARKEVIDKET